ncbi:hypothetical protein [Streptomyces sp. CA-111067]|jgi:hypothetical protein|uniref:hypothetical protein n=1 Tax=Streptomyces sp. CA-111067 TaxID=3240046 RepID=UPI003D981E15
MNPSPRNRSSRGRSRLVPTQLAALAAGVSEATIRKWASRGKITRYGSPGRAQYDLDELLDRVAARSEQAAGRE